MTDPLDYFEREAVLRRPAYRHDVVVEDTLRRMNALLADAPLPPAGPDRPTILVVGLPRSGTTVLYQLLCACLDVGYPDNVVARFWEAPHVGVALSKALLGGARDESFRNDYGTSASLAGPHEFRWFWMRWLGLETIEDHLEFGPEHPKADWAGLRRAVASLHDAFGRPVAFKSLYFSQFLPALPNALGMPLVVHIDRDPRDVALSILNARKAFYGDPNTWWSSFSPDYLQVHDLPFPEQIARQVLGLRRMEEEGLRQLDPSTVLRIRYADACADPGAVVEGVRGVLLDRYGVEVDVVGAPPAALRREREVDVDEDGRAVLAALETLRGG